ncbi:hypothetical protein BACOVA_05391 [Bacteroides ovatus ATCC 8483]|uniref:Uncharacterized protein n=1 Tax=Bacteroides ovatus (strain ATCC 8483 / DSM 1896 / JCM 5824 / BCRC 10623 / CCUG 4943 / NCTC 11153) TaxID=411476 RepID=A0AAN3D7J2_BACO1|nr:hypothetical protein BACOVA_05391 [Bacteroides ovatus ATCC 8483]
MMLFYVSLSLFTILGNSSSERRITIENKSVIKILFKT